MKKENRKDVVTKYFIGMLIGVLIGVFYTMIYVFHTYGFWIK